MQVKPLIGLSQVQLNAGQRAILHDTTMVIAHGGPTVLLGPNGCGKTSLLKLMMGLVSPSFGIVDRHFGRASFVLQKPVMLRRSVTDNLIFARRSVGLPHDQTVISSLLKDFGLTQLARSPARRLSGGEQQRLAIARALAREPDLLFLDEPTASLDVAQTRLVEELIARISARGVKIILSTHDLGQARRIAEEVLFLVDGHVIEQAAMPDFFHRPKSPQAGAFLAGELISIEGDYP
jgi:tungstate transport system ATP-binding protein